MTCFPGPLYPREVKCKKGSESFRESKVAVKPYWKTVLSTLCGFASRENCQRRRRYLELLLILHHPAPLIFLDVPFTGLSPLVREH